MGEDGQRRAWPSPYLRSLLGWDACYATTLSGHLFGCAHQLLRMGTLLDSPQRGTYAPVGLHVAALLGQCPPAPLSHPPHARRGFGRALESSES